jgi:virginiamycin B lyase
VVHAPDGQVFIASLAGNYLGQIDLETGAATVLEPPVPRQWHCSSSAAAQGGQGI